MTLSFGYNLVWIKKEAISYGLLYVLTDNPGKVSIINGTNRFDSMEIIGGNPKKILFNSVDGLAYITKQNNYYSIDVFEDKILKDNIPIKYLYDEIVVNPSTGLVYIVRW